MALLFFRHKGKSNRGITFYREWVMSQARAPLQTLAINIYEGGKNLITRITAIATIKPADAIIILNTDY